jgi:hypothetical protein
LEDNEEDHGASNRGGLEQSALTASRNVDQAPQELEEGSDEHGDDRGRVGVGRVLVLVHLENHDDVEDELPWSVCRSLIDARE